MTTRLSILAATLATILVACGGSDGNSTITVSARVAAPAGGSSASGLSASALSVAGGRVEVEEIWMVVRDVKLGLPNAEGEIVAGNGPFLLHVGPGELQGGVTEEFVIDAPAGTYDELRFVVHRLEDVERIGVPQLDGPRASVAIRLRVDGGAPVVFTSELNATQRIFRTFAVEDGVAPDNITISIDPSGWFGSGGGFLDPRDAGNRQAIEDAIQGSIDAFEDDDHDGLDDDGPNHT